jgi:multiple sugar transport system ATP-binding protein
MNVLPATRDGASFVLPGGWRVPAPRARDGAGDVVVGLRPEAIAIADEGHPVQVLVSEPLGSEVIVNVKLDETIVKVRAPADVRPAAGTTVHLRADPNGVRVFDRGTGTALA